MRRIAFLTLEDRSGYVIDDELAVAELTRRGFDVREIPWSRAETDWSAFDLVIVRTTWDYHKHPAEFLAALTRIEASGTILENPRALIAWNLDKRYLRDLAARGVPIVPGIWVEGGTAETFNGLFDALGTSEIVVKPIVSANALDTFRLQTRLTPQQRDTLVRTFTDRAWLAQPFVKSIVNEGELSIFYFDGQLSHAVQKVPESGDFRVQEEHGGHIAAVSVTDEVRRAADHVIRAVSPAPFQARVDLVRLDDGSLALMELELIEPSLYFRMDQGAPGRFADAVASVLERHASSPR